MCGLIGYTPPWLPACLFFFEWMTSMAYLRPSSAWGRMLAFLRCVMPQLNVDGNGRTVVFNTCSCSRHCMVCPMSGMWYIWILCQRCQLRTRWSIREGRVHSGRLHCWNTKRLVERTWQEVAMGSAVLYCTRGRVLSGRRH